MQTSQQKIPGKTAQEGSDQSRRGNTNQRESHERIQGLRETADWVTRFMGKTHSRNTVLN